MLSNSFMTHNVHMYIIKQPMQHIQYLLPTDVPDSVPMEIRLRMSRATELVIEWDPIPCYNQNGPGFVYVLNINGSEIETAETNFIFTNLQPCSVYEISIITANVNGNSTLNSTVASFTTFPTGTTAGRCIY